MGQGDENLDQDVILKFIQVIICLYYFQSELLNLYLHCLINHFELLVFIKSI